MYFVYCDDVPLYDLRNEELVLISPKIKQKDNEAGSFDFVISPNHPNVDSIVKMKSVITVYEDDDLIFRGRATEVDGDFYKQKTVHCEGMLNFLFDSVQPMRRIPTNGSISTFLTALLNVHNEQVGSEKRFYVGNITVTDSMVSQISVNYEKTFDVIKNELLNRFGGHLRIRQVGSTYYLDYLKNYTTVDDDRRIEFGENLLDYSENFDASDIATIIVPLGYEIPEEQRQYPEIAERLTVKSVNSGKDYIENTSAIALYGKIRKTVYWDDVTLPTNLLRKGQDYIRDFQYDTMILSVTAIDLHNLDSSIGRIQLLDNLHVLSKPHGLDRYFPVTEMEINIDAPEKNKLKLGTEKEKTLTSKQQAKIETVEKQVENIPSKADILEEAAETASELIHNATHGHVVTTADEQLIMDTDDIATARKVWRWNLGGLGYSSDGYNGTFSTAITMDGQIVGEKLIGGSVTAEKLSASYKTQVQRDISSSLTSSKNYTDSCLRSYQTTVEVETLLQNTADAVIIRASEKAINYTDNALKDYSTSAQIKVTTDAITSEVSKKLNSSELSTKIQQNSYAVRMSWNNSSRYIQFEGSALNIYDSSDYKLMSLTYSGQWFYATGSTIGKIGTNNFSSDANFKGLVFDLEYNAGYMCWAAKDSSSAGAYTTKLIYYHKTTTGEKKGLHLDCPTYTKGNLYLTDDYNINVYSDGSIGYSGEIDIYKSIGIHSGAELLAYNNAKLNFYADLDMHGYSIKNQSDVRMKDNITQTSVDALELLNQIDLVEFDWITEKKHENIGIIAQQLQMIEPDLVDEGDDGHLSIKITKFIPYLIKAIQELSTGEYEKKPYIDQYSLEQKKAFCNGLKSGVHVVPKEITYEPKKIPIRK